jgi:hypothetical protein
MVFAGFFRGKLEQAFWRYHEANPQVYQRLCDYAREWKWAGHSICSIQFLCERVRWDFGIRPRENPDGFKLNNNHAAYYSRLIEAQEPDLKNFFKMRTMRIQASFGPDNSVLPSGEHVA